MEGPGLGALVPPWGLHASLWCLSLHVHMRAWSVSGRVDHSLVPVRVPDGAPGASARFPWPRWRGRDFRAVPAQRDVFAERAPPALPAPSDARPEWKRNAGGRERSGQETDSSRPLPASWPCPRAARPRVVSWRLAPPAGLGAKGQPAPGTPDKKHSCA